MPSSSSSVIPVELNNGGTVTTRSIEFRGKTYLLRQEPSSHNHGLVVWDAALCLLDYFQDNPKILSTLSKKRILELGAGTGIVGIVLRDFTQGNIILTDLLSVLPNLQTNIAANNTYNSIGESLSNTNSSSSSSMESVSSIKALPYCWGDNFDHLLADGPIDCIVATDVTYSATLNPLLLRTTASIALRSDQLRRKLQLQSQIIEQISTNALNNSNNNNHDEQSTITNNDAQHETELHIIQNSSVVIDPSESVGSSISVTSPSYCTIYFANEVRDEIAQQVFDTEAEKYFQITRINNKHLPLQWKQNSTMRLFKLKLKRGLTNESFSVI